MIDARMPQLPVADPEESVLEAARRLDGQRTDTLCVVDALFRPTGLLTARDIVTGVVVGGRSPADTTVAEVMSAVPRCFTVHTPAETALDVLRSSGLPCLPIVDASSGRLVGLLNRDDLLALLGQALHAIAEGAPETGAAPAKAPAAPAGPTSNTRS